jgi:hypothetical protein
VGDFLTNLATLTLGRRRGCSSDRHGTPSRKEYESSADLIHRERGTDVIVPDGVLGHRSMLGFRRLLHDRESSGLRDVKETPRPVVATSGEHHAYDARTIGQCR